MKKFRYTAKFDISANIGKQASFSENALVTKASLEDLSALMPDEDFKADNPDLLVTAFNAAVVNLVNANDDAIMTPQALQAARLFQHKHVNIEHMRSMVVGHVINFGFSSFSDSSMLESSGIEEDSLDPFNICLAAVVYRVVDQYFADYLEDSTDPRSYAYHDISASWELGFDEFVVAMGSKKLSDAEIVSDDAGVKELAPYLRSEGGAGFTPDGTPVYRVVSGEVQPLGIGFTSTPAAAVKGVVTANDKPKAVCLDDFKKYIASDPDVLAAIASNIDKNDNQPEKSNKNISQKQTTPVNTNVMKINSIDDIQQDVMAEMQASDIRNFVRDSIKSQLDKANEEFKSLEQEKEAREADLLAAKTDAAEAKKELEDVKAKLDKVLDKQEAAMLQAQFNDRMASLDEAYELSDGERAVIAKQIRDLNAEDYKSWKEDFETLYASKVKTDEPVDSPEDALASVEDKGQDSPPNAADSNEDPTSKYAKAFELGEGITFQQ